MPRIVIEEDHFLKIVPVVLDPATPAVHQRAVAEFFAHDEPDFPGWCRRLQQRLPGLYPADVVFAEDQAELAVKIAEADGVIVESLVVDQGPTGATTPAVNTAFVSVTVCVPATTTCQTIDHIEVDETQPPHSCRCQVKSQRRAEPTGADQENAGRLEAFLALHADFRHDQVPAVAQDFVSIQ